MIVVVVVATVSIYTLNFMTSFMLVSMTVRLGKKAEVKAACIVQ